MNIKDFKNEQKIRTQFTLKKKNFDELIKISREMKITRFRIVEKLIEEFIEQYEKYQKGEF